MSITTIDGYLVPLSDIGTIATPSLYLSDVYYIPPYFAMNLVLYFVVKICDSEYNVYFSPSDCFVQDDTSHKVIEIGRRQTGLYVLN